MINASLIIKGETKQTKVTTTVHKASNSDVIGTYWSASKEDVDSAYESARNSFPAWRDTEMHKRVDALNKISQELSERSTEIAKVVSDEIAKPYKDSLSEVERTVELIKLTAEYAKQIRGESMSGDGLSPYKKNQKLAVSNHVPLGVILCISPFNYPINLAASKLAPAIVSGNTVVFKSASQGVLSGYLLAEIFNKHLPSGVINFISGKASEIGDHLITHEQVDMINFTGSTNVGERIKKVSKVPYLLELGGKDFAVVTNKADLNKAISEIVKGSFSYSGQRCTAIKSVLVQEEIYFAFMSKLKDAVAKLKVGEPEDEVNVSYLINENSVNFVNGLIEDAIDKGGQLSWKMKIEGNLVYPLIIEIKNLNTRLLFEEQFAPILPVYKFRDLREAITITNSSIYGLQSDIFTQDINEAFEFANEIDAGTVQINGKSDRGPDTFPFTGTKASGLGTQGIKESILAMTKLKTIVVNL